MADRDALMPERIDPVADAMASVVAGLVAGEVRDGQLGMGRAVADAIERDRHLVVRAGTGTGKSLAYLVPAVLSKKKVLVATATKALQDQLAGKDLPLVGVQLETDFSFAVLKGRSNYLCRQRVRESSELSVQGELDAEDESPVASSLGADVDAVLAWAKTTASGDRAELGIEPDPQVWAAFSVSSEECPGAFRCPSGGDCFAESARKAAEQADIVIVNLALFGADIASDGAVLPEHEVTIIDEAHDLEQVMSTCLGMEISSGRMRAAAALARVALGEAAPTRRRSLPRTSPVEDLFEVAERFDAVFTSRDGERLRPPIDEQTSEVIDLASARLDRLQQELRARSEALAASSDSEATQRTIRAVLVCGRLREDFARLSVLGDDDVAWVAGGQRPSLRVAPIDVASILQERLFSRHSTVLTSATVPLGLAVRLGADPERTDSLDVGSPFDYEHHALLYCAAHLPDRRHVGAQAAITDELERLITAAGGRTLALFTARAVMKDVAGELRDRVSYPILLQGELTKASLLEHFASEEAACLFATMGFWQGVDVPGPTLSLVVIDRLPFARPDDPLMSARRDRAGSSAFRLIDLPRAATLLAQGAGRLIRTSDDRGVVAVLDSRLATASYRWDLIRSLPPMRRTKDIAEVRAFFAEMHGQSL